MYMANVHSGSGPPSGDAFSLGFGVTAGGSESGCCAPIENTDTNITATARKAYAVRGIPLKRPITLLPFTLVPPRGLDCLDLLGE